MNVRIIARHCTVPDAVVLRAHRRVEGLRRFDPRLLAADIAFERAHDRYCVDILLKVAKTPDVFGRGEAEDLGTALDRAIQKLRRQLVRGREKARDHRATPLYALTAGG